MAKKKGTSELNSLAGTHETNADEPSTCEPTVSALAPNPKNPRRIQPEQLRRLRKSLDEFGDLGGVVRNRQTGFMIGGHQRIAAFEASKPKVVIETRLDSPDRVGTVAYGYVEVNGVRYSFREVDWDEQRERLAMVAANKHGGDWDSEMLYDILRELNPETLSLVGFEEVELASLRPPDPPASFPRFDENIPIQHKCPSCGYQWSGKAA